MTAAVTSAGPGRIAVTGALTFATAQALADEGGRLLAAQEGQRLEVDLQGIGGADSAGLALLIGWLAQARAAGVELHYSGVPERLLAIARISEVDGLLTSKSL